jgi:hypothetical protein
MHFSYRDGLCMLRLLLGITSESDMQAHIGTEARGNIAAYDPRYLKAFFAPYHLLGLILRGLEF